MKYTKEIINQICDELRLGQTREDACAYVGIHKDTFYDWLKKKSEFSDAVLKAETECKRRCIGIIQKASITTWQAAAWWLERKYKNEFSLRSELTGSDGGNPVMITSILARMKVKDIRDIFRDIVKEEDKK